MFDVVPKALNFAEDPLSFHAFQTVQRFDVLASYGEYQTADSPIFRVRHCTKPNSLDLISAKGSSPLGPKVEDINHIKAVAVASQIVNAGKRILKSNDDGEEDNEK
ncbi:MAG: hypothetical protein WBQ79_19305 [Acidobacteriaceae bacterium]